MTKKNLERDLKRFKDRTGYKCDLKNPQTFMEKIMYKKIHDRNPLLPYTADKLNVRNFIIDILGKGFKKHFTRILFKQENYEYDFIPELKKGFILKVNNASGRLMYLHNNMLIGDRKERIYNRIKTWFTVPYGKEKLEWAYQEIKPIVFGEELIFENNELPLVFRFDTFNERVEYIKIYKYTNEFKKRFIVESITNYNRKFELLNVKFNERPIGNTKLSKFTNELIYLSEELCKNNFDYCRVDFLVTKNNFYFSELTHYPMSGTALITPHEFDIEMGSKWKIEGY